MNLKNLRVLVTRSNPKGEELCAEIRARQGNPIALPTLEIRPISNEKMQQQIKNLEQFDWLIFISPHAADQGLAAIRRLHSSIPEKIRIAAIGANTAKVLQQEKLSRLVFPVKEWSSEGLLALPEFQHIRGKRIAIIKGVGGREMLAKHLAERGALIETIDVYQRVMPKIDNIEKYIDLLKTQQIDIIVCTSGQGLIHLIKLIGRANLNVLQTIPLMVISDRLVSLAQELQFKHVYLAENASHDSIINALETVQTMLGNIYGGHTSNK